ncbi:MAG: hypothetical protein ACKO38_05000 [Planctomycetota bacterium]
MASSSSHLIPCHSPNHTLRRRAFFGAAGSGAAGLGLLSSPLLADQ